MKIMRRNLFKSAFVFVLAFFMMGVTMTPQMRNDQVYAANSSVITDTDVRNTASFATNTIYHIVTDRFWNGDPTNDPTTDISVNAPWGTTTNNRYYHGGDWAGITYRINDGYLTDLGITAIWISPPNKNIDTFDPADRSQPWAGTSYHGYWGLDFFRPNPFFGCLNDFREMINVAAQNDIKIIIDFVPNHTSATTSFGHDWEYWMYPWDGALYRDGVPVGRMSDPEEATRRLFNHEGWISDWSNWENTIYGELWGLADLNQMNPTIDEYMKDAINFWLDLGVAGIRVDAVKHMPQGWQKNWLNSVYRHKPVFVFGEWFDHGTMPCPIMVNFANDTGMHLLDFNFAYVLNGTFGTLRNNMHDVYATIQSTAAAFNQVNNMATFLDNHDVARITTVANGHTRSVDAALVMQMTNRGVPIIYYGTEQYMMGAADPDNRNPMVSWDRTTNAFQIIAQLSRLRRTNPALAYGTFRQRWINNDVLVFERQFGDSVVLTAVNRNTSQGFHLNNIHTNLPPGTYQDHLNSVLNGGHLVVPQSGVIPHYFLGPGMSAVWQFTATTENRPIIGSVDPLVGSVGSQVTIVGRGFGNTIGQVTVGGVNAQIRNWSDSLINIIVPNLAAGRYNVVVRRSNNITSYAYPGFRVLTGPQTAVRFFVDNAHTAWGQNVYIVGNIIELGNWDPNRAIRMFNSSASIAQFPSWFQDVSVPKNTRIEFKFIMRNPQGQVIWESGANRVITTGTRVGEHRGGNFRR